MVKVITYGTYDMLHHGHYRLLERAKALGDYLIVGITSDSYDKYRGKLNVIDPLPVRIDNVKATGFVDEIIVEEYEGQKIDDIINKNIDIFAIGSDWAGQFDFLNDYCRVVYLDRTRGISSTERRSEAHGIIRFGVAGTGRMAESFLSESKFVSGIMVDTAMDSDIGRASDYANRHELSLATDQYDTLLSRSDAIYISTPHDSHYEYITRALSAGKHVLCEKPMVSSAKEARTLYELAAQKKLLLMESLITLHCPGFQRLISLAKSGRIGEIKSVDAVLTNPLPAGRREITNPVNGGSMAELFSYPALAVHRLLGKDPCDVRFLSQKNSSGVDIFTKIDWRFEKAAASIRLSLGIQGENDLVISGTRGYIYVPSPWWQTDYYEIRTVGGGETKKYYYEFIGNGIRYVLVDFLRKITEGIGKESEDSIALAALVERYRSASDIDIMG